MLLCLLISGAAAGAGDLDGRRGLMGDREAVSGITLKPVGSVEFELIYVASDYWGKGVWRQAGETGIFTSTSKEEPPFRLVKSATPRGVGMRVWVDNARAEGRGENQVALHSSTGEQETNTTCEGMAGFRPVNLDPAVELRHNGKAFYR